jgi:hypothetical protein
MSYMQRIPVPWRIPEGYQRKFIAIGADGRKSEICPNGPNELLMIIGGSEPPATPLETSRTLDWIQEAVETIRWECEEMNGKAI